MDPFPHSSLLGDQAPAAHPTNAAALKSRYEQLRSFVKMALVDGALSAEESEYIKRMGAELGLRHPEIARIVREEQGRPRPRSKAPPQKQAAAVPTPKRDLTELKRLLTEYRGRSDHRFKEIAAEAALGGLIGLGALAAPLLVVSAIVLLIVPALATTGQVRKMKLGGAPGWRVVLFAAPRLPQNAVLSIYYLIPVAMVCLAAALLVLWSARRFDLPSELLLGFLVAWSILLWLWWILYRASDAEDFLRTVRSTARTLVSWSLRRRAYGYRHILLSFPACLLLGLARAEGVAFWWPLR